VIGLRKALKKVLGRSPAPGPAPAPADPPAKTAEKATEDLPWYLQGDRDAGWDATNPGTEPEKKNLTEK
jgi:hypothetical protein